VFDAEAVASAWIASDEPVNVCHSFVAPLCGLSSPKKPRYFVDARKLLISMTFARRRAVFWLDNRIILAPES